MVQQLTVKHQRITCRQRNRHNHLFRGRLAGTVFITGTLVFNQSLSV